MPQVLSSRVDLLGTTSEGDLIHIELQSANDADTALRMAEYALRIYRQFRKFPKQIVLYVGEPKLRMTAELGTADFIFRYGLMDIRELDGASLLASNRIEDNLLAILTRLGDRTAAIREILVRIANLDEPARRAAFARFLIISGVRRLAQTIKEETQKMPILNDILEHEVIGPAILQGRQEGRRDVLRSVLVRRFGPIPDWAEERLASLSADDLDGLVTRILDASCLEEIFPAKS